MSCATLTSEPPTAAFAKTAARQCTLEDNDDEHDVRGVQVVACAYLSLLQLNDTLLDGVHDSEALDEDVLPLAEAMHTVERLVLDGLAPGEVHANDA